MDLTELFKSYDMELDLLTRSQKTKDGYKSVIKKFTTENSRVYRMSEKEIKLYMSNFRLRYSDSYYNVMGSALIILYRDVLKQPQKMKWFKSLIIDRKYHNIVTNEQFISMMKSTTNLKHKLIIIILYSTGIRESELINLKLTDVDLVNNQFFIRSLKHGKNRHVAIHELTARYLHHYLHKFKPKEYLIEGQTKPQYTASSIQKIFKKASEGKVYPHLMRHTFGTKTIENEDVFATMELLGHRSLKSTLHYNHISKERIKTMYNPLNEVTI